MRALLRQIFLHDALLKGISLLLAVVLFVVVRSDRDAATSAFIKVVYKLPLDRVLTSDPVGELRIGIRGPWTRVTRFDERQLDPINIDLSSVSSGDLRFGEDQVKLPVGLRVASISPPSVVLRFEPRVERDVPIQAVVEGDPAPGYRVGATAAHPHRVRIAGAKSVVDGIQRVSTRPLRVSDARAKVEGRVKLEAPPPHAFFVGGDEVTVEADVVRDMAERIVRAVPVRVTGLARLDGVFHPDVAEVVLRGPVEALAAVSDGTLALVVDAPSEDARPPNTYAKSIRVVGVPTGVAAEVRPKDGTLVTRRRRD